MRDSIEHAVDLLRQADHVVVFTGAGVSKESGLPTFREAQEGLWAKYDPEELASMEGFRRDPEMVWAWYQHRRTLYGDVEPNPGHHAIVELEELVPRVVVVTQNVDDLHRRAGSTDLIELHGNIYDFKCLDEGHRLKLADLEGQAETPPRCPHCGSLVRPDVVWFGELLPAEALDRAFWESRQCDVMLVVGTSAVVQPAATLPYEAADHGASIVEVNPNPSGASHIADVLLQGPSGEVLPRVLGELRRQKGSL
ncbi:MAG: NAD-dependent protein deacylase Sir2 [Anaerolineales bacterium]|nr:NAD-dependent protein deacylase Sir2 [Anaerolineales bacterium]